MDHVSQHKNMISHRCEFCTWHVRLPKPKVLCMGLHISHCFAHSASLSLKGTRGSGKWSRWVKVPFGRWLSFACSLGNACICKFVYFVWLIHWARNHGQNSSPPSFLKDKMRRFQPQKWHSPVLQTYQSHQHPRGVSIYYVTVGLAFLFSIMIMMISWW